MSMIGLHPAPGNTNQLLPGWVAVRDRGVGDIVDTRGFSVPDRAMVAPIDMTPGIGDILQTSGFAVPQNPVVAYTSGQVKPIGSSGIGCACEGKINGVGVGDLTADFNTISGDFSSGNYMGALQAPIMGIPYGIPLILGALFVLPMVLGGGGGRRRR